MDGVLSDNAAVKPGSALLIFHLRVGARLAMRVLAPAIAVVFAAYFILRPEFLVLLLQRLIADGTLWETGLLLFALLRLAAGAASPRITAGRRGWMGHLPVPRRTRRRLEAAAVFAALCPVLLVLAAFSIAAVSGAPDRSPAVVVAGLVLAAWAAASSAIPGASQPARFLSVAAGVAAAAGQAPFIAAGAVLLAFGEAAEYAGAFTRPETRIARGFREIRGGRRLEPVILLRALRWRPAACLALATVPLAASWLFVRNNEVSPALARSAWRTGGALGITIFLAGIAAAAAVRRPVWPWLRSLPQSSGERILKDAAVFLALTLPLLAVIAVLGGSQTVSLIALLPLACLRAAAAMRTSPDTRFGPAGRLLVEGAFAALLLALSAWSALIFPGLVPLAYLDARSQERSVPATRWAGFHHRQAGDSLSWSRS